MPTNGDSDEATQERLGRGHQWSVHGGWPDRPLGDLRGCRRRGRVPAVGARRRAVGAAEGLPVHGRGRWCRGPVRRRSVGVRRRRVRHGRASSRASASASDPARHAGAAVPRHPGRDRVRRPAALRGPALRPPHLRLLGERRARLQPVAARLAAGARRRRPRRPAHGHHSRTTRSRRHPMPRRTRPPSLPRALRAEDPTPQSMLASATDVLAGDDLFATPGWNPFAPGPGRDRPRTDGVPRKFALLDRGRGIFGSYARVAYLADDPVAYAQFGPLSAYPRAQRIRELYPQLPSAPPPGSSPASPPSRRRAGWATHGRSWSMSVTSSRAEASPRSRHTRT